tara:strand:- start:15 stop:587 length:573 start_codon:yes stop_codon:yes gene_type:complete
MNNRIALSSLMLAVGAVVLAVPVMKGTEQIEATMAESDAPVAVAKPNPWGTADSAPAQVQPLQESSGWGGQVTLYRYPDGHFYADVLVDGQQLHMLVDTGASVIALTGDDARRLGVSWNSFELSTIGQGASGPVEGVGTKLDRVSLGGIEASDVTAVVIPEGLHVSLLGQSFLTELGKVEIAGDRMVIGS